MKATGIVRRIDDLGRVVVPKEIRRTLRIREGDPLEIFTDREGEIILKKYSPIGELSAFAKQYAESLSQVLECLVGICDMDQVVAAAGNGKKEIQDEDITGELGEFLKERKTRNAKAGEKRYVPIVSVSEPYKQEVISPILCAGDVIGAVFLLNQERTDRFKDTELCLAEYTAKVLGKQNSKYNSPKETSDLCKFTRHKSTGKCREQIDRCDPCCHSFFRKFEFIQRHCQYHQKNSGHYICCQKRFRMKILRESLENF